MSDENKSERAPSPSKERDIRPVAEHNHIRDVLYLQDIERFFAEVDVAKWRTLERCPACDASGLGKLFEKDRFRYSRCSACGHQFVNPMPDQESVNHWYRTAESQKAFNRLIEKAGAARREQLYRKRLTQLLELVPSCRSLVEVGCGTGGFLKFARETRPDLRVVGCDLDPYAAAIAREQHGVEVIVSAAEDLDLAAHSFDVVALFEVIEHTIEPGRFLSAIKRAAPAGTHLIMSTPNHEGFEPRVLGRGSRNYMAPGHLNLFGKESMARALARAGFSSWNILANGRLDVDIVRSHYEAGRYLPDEFMRAVFDEGNDAFCADMQTVLIKHNLSGNMLVHAVA